MNVWIVYEEDDHWVKVIAVYPTEKLADEHVALMGGNIEAAEVRNELHPAATDPAQQALRAAQAEKARKEWQEYQERQERDAKHRSEVRPRPPHMTLCHCETFSKDRWFVNAHGYCGYCGGFTPTVFLQHMGREALHVEIDKLAIHYREQMREIVKAL